MEKFDDGSDYSPSQTESSREYLCVTERPEDQQQMKCRTDNCK